MSRVVSRKPTYDICQWTGENLDEIALLGGDDVRIEDGTPLVAVHRGTLAEAWIRMSKGAWLVKMVGGPAPPGTLSVEGDGDIMARYEPVP